MLGPLETETTPRKRNLAPPSRSVRHVSAIFAAVWREEISAISNKISKGSLGLAIVIRLKDSGVIELVSKALITLELGDDGPW